MHRTTVFHGTKLERSRLMRRGEQKKSAGDEAIKRLYACLLAAARFLCARGSKRETATASRRMVAPSGKTTSRRAVFALRSNFRCGRYICADEMVAEAALCGCTIVYVPRRHSPSERRQRRGRGYGAAIRGVLVDKARTCRAC